MISPELPEHGLQRGIIADIARAEDAEQADPGSGGGLPRAPVNPVYGQQGLLSRPGTTASTEMTGCSAGVGSPARTSRPGRARLANHRAA